MPLLRQVGGRERTIYSLRYRLTDGRTFELSFNAAESPEDEATLSGLQLLADLYPKSAPLLGGKRTDSVKVVTAAWLELAGDRIAPLRRLAFSLFPDLIADLLRQELSQLPPDRLVSAARLERRAGELEAFAAPLGVQEDVLYAALQEAREREVAKESQRWVAYVQELCAQAPRQERPALTESYRQQSGQRLASDFFFKEHKLQSQTFQAFGLHSGSSLRLEIPLRDADGEIYGQASRALVEHLICEVCCESVSAREWARRQDTRKRLVDSDRHFGRRTPGDDSRRCPHCGASAEASGLWILDDQYPRYRLSSGTEQRCHLYNADQAALALRDKRYRRPGLFLVEGYTDAWAIHGGGQEAVVAYNSARPSEIQLELALELVREAGPQIPLILVPHLDPAGQNSVSHILAAVHKLEPERQVLILNLDALNLSSRAPDLKREEVDIARVLQILDYGLFVDLFTDNQLYLDGVAWQVRLVLETTRRDGQPLQSPDSQQQSVAYLIEHAGYQPNRDNLLDYLKRGGGCWGWTYEQVDEFVDAHLEARLGKQLTKEQQEWIASFGSADLTYALSRGYDVNELYVQERAEQEIGPGVIIDFAGDIRPGKRNHPTRAGLRTEREVAERAWQRGVSFPPERLRIVWLDSGQEAVRVERYLGRYNAYLPVPQEVGVEA